MHVSLTSELEQYTRQKVKSGMYNNTSEVIRGALREMVKTDGCQNHLTSDSFHAH
ncbi:type II toxin-antitoxin system ParD family antitoxin [Akkermansiaceae bacterium]|nr:type II toxin-antitoxin system ParD family antitoxin [Akkermansiaceae bacterium]